MRFFRAFCIDSTKVFEMCIYSQVLVIMCFIYKQRIDFKFIKSNPR